MQLNTKKTTATKPKEKNAQLIQQIQKFEHNIKKKKANIQKKYTKSVVNKLYIYPRCASLSSSTSSSSNQSEIENTYNLKSQNQKSRKNQTKRTQDVLQAVKIKEYNSVKSDNSIHSIEQGGKTLKNRKSKNKNIQINFETKKKTPAKVKATSQRKLFSQQYSLDNRAYATNKQYNNLIVSFRGTKKHEINISLSGRRMKTQIH